MLHANLLGINDFYYEVLTISDLIENQQFSPSNLGCGLKNGAFPGGKAYFVPAVFLSLIMSAQFSPSPIAEPAASPLIPRQRTLHMTL
jgi:hypothetical protein